MRRLIGTLVAALSLAAAPAAFGLDVQYALSGTAGDGAWFISPVTVKWTLSGEIGSTNCDTTTLTQDTVDTAVTCTATDGTGSFSRTAHIRIDRTAPTGVTAAASRPPDHGAWYTTPVQLTWSGSDATSGVASCTTLTYDGPDAAATQVLGGCRDRAGNTSAATPFMMAFDATPPALTGLSATVRDRRATVRWSAEPDTSTTVVRTPGDGRASARATDVGAGVQEVVDAGLAPGRTYTWTVTVRDAAGNAASSTTTAAVPRSAVSRVIRWRGTPGADYYNIQIWRKGHKILSAWPTRAQFTLPRTWRFQGRRHRLVPGVYRYYVWPGYGPATQRRFGRMIGAGRLTVPRT